MLTVATLIAAGSFALVHISVARLRFLDNNPGRWMSAAGGVGIAYVSLFLFTAAMILHFATVDRGMRHKYGGLYDRFIRWMFVAASLGGWLIAITTEIPYTILALLTSLFVGALIVMTIKEKTPGSDRVHFAPFLAGVTGYVLLLLTIEALT